MSAQTTDDKLPTTQERRDASPASIKGEVERWVEQCILELNLCPFAAVPYRKGLVHIEVCEARVFETVIGTLLGEIEKLIMTSPRKLSNTLVVFRHAFEEFDDFLDAAATFNAMLERSNLHDSFQVATFHPDYYFANSKPTDRGNLTNRSPYPIFHLLREDEMTDVLARYSAPEQIPIRNVQLLSSLDLDDIAKRWPFIDPSSLTIPENA
jgi:hypothetical protein